MLKIRIAAVGRLRGQGFRESASEYEKRLRAYCKLDIYEVDISRKVEERTRKSEEGRKLLSGKILNGKSIACDRKGKQVTSEEFAAIIRGGLDLGIPFTFFLGGPDGLSSEILSSATLSISFSKMTFPHELFRIVLLEQVYRSFRIIRGEPYHR